MKLFVSRNIIAIMFSNKNKLTHLLLKGCQKEQKLRTIVLTYLLHNGGLKRIFCIKRIKEEFFSVKRIRN